MLKRKLVRTGMAVVMAESVLGQTQAGLTATGTNLATGLVLGDDTDVAVFTTVAASTAAVLPAMEVGDEVTVANLGANALLLFTKSALENVNALGAGAGFSIAAGKNAWVKKISALTYIGLIGA